MIKVSTVKFESVSSPHNARGTWCSPIGNQHPLRCSWCNAALILLTQFSRHLQQKGGNSKKAGLLKHTLKELFEKSGLLKCVNSQFRYCALNISWQRSEYMYLQSLCVLYFLYVHFECFAKCKVVERLETSFLSIVTQSLWTPVRMDKISRTFVALLSSALWMV